MPIKLQANHLLKKFTTFKIGGPAKYFTIVKNINEAISVFKFIKKHNLDFLVIGKGSNVLIDSKGFDGIVILNRIDHLKIKENYVTVGSGYKYPLLAHKMQQYNLTGLEFAGNIPATVGGAIFMNAGANGYETASQLKQVVYFTNDLQLLTLEKDDLEFDYRKSIFQKKRGMILEATFALKVNSNGNDLQKSFTNYRLRTQPNANYCAGCIFQNPTKDISAGFLIEKCNLKNMRIGGAVVSDKHANFIINDNNATSDDVIKLINLIKKIVKDKTGYKLKSEVRHIPYGN